MQDIPLLVNTITYARTRPADVAVPSTLLSRLRHALPAGRTLPATTWERRHRVIVSLLWGHAIAMLAITIMRGYSPQHVLLEAGGITVLAALASVGRLTRSVRASLASVGLLTASAVVVHLSGGYIEAHFHFFVMVAIIALYQDWAPYLFAIGYVILHHGIVGVLDPESVYNHAGAWDQPWRWAVIHGIFILGASAASVVHWRLNESAQAAVVREQSARLAAESEVRLREEFLSMAAHELKTPLTTVKASAQFLGRLVEGRSADVDRLSGHLNSQVVRLETLVSDLLDVARIQHGAIGLQRETVDLRELAREVIERFENSPLRTAAHNIVLDARTPVHGCWDRVRLDQVLTNLLSNALKYSPLGGEVRVKLRGDGEHAVITVRDHGVGIPLAEQSHIFEAFTRSVESRHLAEGTGLGLFIARRIVEEHDGLIELRSTPATTTFTVRLPSEA
jgi:signal transduction histidine kinase